MIWSLHGTIREVFPFSLFAYEREKGPTSHHISRVPLPAPLSCVYKRFLIAHYVVLRFTPRVLLGYPLTLSMYSLNQWIIQVSPHQRVIAFNIQTDLGRYKEGRKGSYTKPNVLQYRTHEHIKQQQINKMCNYFQMKLKTTLKTYVFFLDFEVISNIYGTLVPIKSESRYFENKIKFLILRDTDELGKRRASS